MLLFAPNHSAALARRIADALGTSLSSSEEREFVEDNRAMRDALKIYLELDEHEVHTAASMAELDELLDTLEASPSIIISDFHLGAHDRGSDAIERIRQHFKCVLPAILLTGDTSSVPARLAGESGIRMLNKHKWGGLVLDSQRTATRSLRSGTE